MAMMDQSDLQKYLSGRLQQAKHRLAEASAEVGQCTRAIAELEVALAAVSTRAAAARARKKERGE